MPLTFSNPEVDKKYTSDRDNNPPVHLPGGKNAKGWKGRLADIPLEQADRWVSQPGQNLLKLKDAAAAEEKPAKGKPKPSDN